MRPATPAETMVVTASRALRDGERVLVGVGLPQLACLLAQRTHAPSLTLIYEAGVVGAVPSRLPLAIGDPALVSGAAAVCSMFELFALYLQGGWVDVGFLGAAQIDRFGNLNSTVIGRYESPRVRLPGSGGACDIAINARRVLVLLAQDTRRFVDKVDFVTSPGYPGGREGRAALGLPGAGPEKVITDLGMLGFDEDGEMRLEAVHPGVTVDTVKARTGWPLRVVGRVEATEPPTGEDLRLLREVLDVRGVYLRR